MEIPSPNYRNAMSELPLCNTLKRFTTIALILYLLFLAPLIVFAFFHTYNIIFTLFLSLISIVGMGINLRNACMRSRGHDYMRRCLTLYILLTLLFGIGLFVMPLLVWSDLRNDAARAD